MAKTVSFTSAGKRQLHDEMLCERMFLHRNGAGRNPWHIAGQYSPTSTTNQSLSANVMWAVAFFAPPFGAVADRLGIYVTSASSGSVRLGIYAALGRNHNYSPGALLVDGGEVAVNSTGEKTVTIDQELEANCLYYAALLSSSTALVSATTITDALLDNIFGRTYTDFTAHYWRNSVLVNYTYGVLPSMFPAFDSSNESVQYLRIGIRYSA